MPEELQGLEALLSDTYFCNLSIFQSMPDSWAIKQLFPIMPIHRLNEPPTRRAVLGDITCDSDGKIDQFIDLRDVRNTLELHPYDGQPYYLGAFLLGAYQEILGDLHNLFGDTNAVHVSLDEDGEIDLVRRHQGRHRPRGAALRAVLRRRTHRRHAQGRRARRPHGKDLAGRIAAVAALLRIGAGRLYVHGMSMQLLMQGSGVVIFGRPEGAAFESQGKRRCWSPNLASPARPSRRWPGSGSRRWGSAFAAGCSRWQ